MQAGLVVNDFDHLSGPSSGLILFRCRKSHTAFIRLRLLNVSEQANP